MILLDCQMPNMDGFEVTRKIRELESETIKPNGVKIVAMTASAMNFSTEYNSDQAKVLAYTVITLIPALIFYAIAERQLVGGLTSGAVKG